MRLFILGTIALCTTLAHGIPAHAQNGQLIEGLFRTWAATQMEKDRRKRAETESRLAESLRQSAETERSNGRAVEVAFPDDASYRSALPSGSRQINVRSREAADYAQTLVQFAKEYDALLLTMRSNAARNHALRNSLPLAYEIAASCRILIQNLDGLVSIQSIVESHRLLDQRYRHLAFRLRSIDQLDSASLSRLRQCDRFCETMIEQLSLSPQFDRVELSEVVIAATTYMQAFIDDVEFARIDQRAGRSLQHDCRVLRQRLVAANREISEMPYDECVRRFRDFMEQWNQFSSRAYSVNDPYLNRRLDRIAQCADRAYELLRQPPPTSFDQVAEISHRVERYLIEISKQLSFHAMLDLTPREQSQLLTKMRSLISMARDLESKSQRGDSKNDLIALFTAMDRSWCETKPILGSIGSVKSGLIAEAEHGYQHLRDVFGLHPEYAGPARQEDLVRIAAELEGLSRQMRRLLESQQRSIQPSSYRKRLLDSSRNFERHCREVHQLLSRSERLGDREHLAKLSEETDHLLDEWKHLSDDLSHTSSHGVRGQTASNIQRLQQEMTPHVGQIAAVLIGR